MDCTRSVPSVYRIFQARILECVAISTLKLPANGISQHSGQRRHPEAGLKEFRPCGGGLVTQSCLILTTPWTVACQAPPSMGFSRQKYWSQLPFPSPGDLSNPGIEAESPTLQADSLAAEPQGKPKNTGVGSLSLLQWIFSTQGSNPGLLHCSQILYQLSYKGSPFCLATFMHNL